MKEILLYVLYADIILMIVSILLQQKGANLGMAFGGDGAFFRKKRGPEKILHYVSIITATVFLVLSLMIPFAEQLI